MSLEWLDGAQCYIISLSSKYEPFKTQLELELLLFPQFTFPEHLVKDLSFKFSSANFDSSPGTVRNGLERIIEFFSFNVAKTNQSC
jgi:hypothetical protein